MLTQIFTGRKSVMLSVKGALIKDAPKLEPGVRQGLEMGAQGGTGILPLPLGGLGALFGGVGLLPSLIASSMQSELASPSTTNQAALFPGSPAPASSSWSGKMGPDQTQSCSRIHHRSHNPYSQPQRASTAAAHEAPP